MLEFLGKEIILTVGGKTISGIFHKISNNDEIIEVLDNNKIVTVNIKNIENIELVYNKINQNDCHIIKEKQANTLNEQEMYNLFYDAFNTYGPTEDQFIIQGAIGILKIIKDKKKIKIIIGSDDVFGRIGLCLARLLLQKKDTHKITVVVLCNIKNIDTVKYKYMYLNNGGIISLLNDNNEVDQIIFASNRNFEFQKICHGEQVVYLYFDVPEIQPFRKALGVGFGFTPNTFSNCKSHFYIIDMSFSNVLYNMYNIKETFNYSVIRKTNF
ncbi:hypothetical protein EBI_26129 [Enterocytozoon bieneusi H348]|nr:hypothetical protein EBI_26129 [Enterocytozoon bieneusi H348]|eukprot:XP_002649616.1 hypothetical protein EBI_26129 [Enterocytozoon bieneusi H348]